MWRRGLAMIMSELALMAAYGCGGSSGGTGLDLGGGGGGLWIPSCDGIAGKPADLTLYASDFASHVGGTIFLSVVVRDGTCSPMTMDLTNSWSVSPATMGTLEVFPKGERARWVPNKVGDATVTVRKDGFIDNRYIRVYPHVASFSLYPASSTVRVGDSVQVSLVALDAAGQRLFDMRRTSTITVIER